MTFLKYIAMLVLTLSIVVAGFSPAQAGSECQMVVKMQMQNMQGMTDCQGCDKTPKNDQKKNSCCDSTQCSFSSSMSINFPAMQIATAIGTQARLVYPDAAMIVSAHLNSQERPPKSLS
jgi:hypothetical protein